MTDIIKQGAQILNAKEYNDMRAALNHRHRYLFDGLIFTGMRGEEFWRFCDNPHWFHPERQYIGLPVGSIKKQKSRFKERTVLLSHVGTRAVRDLVDAIQREEVKRISKVGWKEDLQRAAGKSGMSLEGIVPKMTRKTCVSWLMAIYPTDGLRISASLGHDTRTMVEHYLSLPFSAVEKEQIKPLVVGWGGNN